MIDMEEQDETTEKLLDAGQRLVWRAEGMLHGVGDQEGRERLEEAVKGYKASWVAYNREHPPGPGAIEKHRMEETARMFGKEGL